MEQPPYIQHSLVISKLPYLPPPKTRGCVLHTHMPIRARVYALLLLVGFRARALHLLVGCGQNQGAWPQPVERVEPDYTVIQPSRVWRARRQHPAIPIPSVYQRWWYTDHPKRNTHWSRKFPNSAKVFIPCEHVHTTDRTPVSKVPLLVSNK